MYSYLPCYTTFNVRLIPGNPQGRKEVMAQGCSQNSMPIVGRLSANWERREKRSTGQMRRGKRREKFCKGNSTKGGEKQAERRLPQLQESHCFGDVLACALTTMVASPPHYTAQSLAMDLGDSVHFQASRYARHPSPSPS